MFNCHLVALLVALMRLTTMLFKLVIEEIRREGWSVVVWGVWSLFHFIGVKLQSYHHKLRVIQLFNSFDSLFLDPVGIMVWYRITKPINGRKLFFDTGLIKVLPQISKWIYVEVSSGSLIQFNTSLIKVCPQIWKWIYVEVFSGSLILCNLSESYLPLCVCLVSKNIYIQWKTRWKVFLFLQSWHIWETANIYFITLKIAVASIPPKLVLLQ